MKVKLLMLVFALQACPSISLSEIHITPEDTTSTPIMLSTAGETYILETGFVASGTAFNITQSNVTLDLNGNTVYFDWNRNGDCNGVFISSVRESVRVTNGTIRQRPTGGPSVEAVYFDEACPHPQVDNLEIHINGTDAMGIFCRTARLNPNIHHNTIYNTQTEITNRHSLFASIKLSGAALTYDSGHGYIFSNTIIGGAQSGIVIQPAPGPQTDLGDTLFIFDNDISQSSSSTNGFGIHLYNQPNAVISGNFVHPTNGRGISIELDDYQAATNGQNGNYVRVNNNVVDVRERPNSEYPGSFVTAYGIKIEETSRVDIFGNTVTAHAWRNDNIDDYGSASALSLTLTETCYDVRIFNNTFIASHEGGTATSSNTNIDFATCVGIWENNGDASAGTADLYFANNDLRTNHLFVYERDPALTRAWTFENCHFSLEGITPTPLNRSTIYFFAHRNTPPGPRRFLDVASAGPGVDLSDYEDHIAWATAWEYGQFWSTEVVVLDNQGNFVPGIRVAAKDLNGDVVVEASTGMNGRVNMALPNWVNAKNSPFVSDYSNTYNNYLSVWAYSEVDSVSVNVSFPTEEQTIISFNQIMGPPIIRSFGESD